MSTATTASGALAGAPPGQRRGEHPSQPARRPLGRRAGLGLTAAALALAVTASLLVGAAPLPPSDVWAALTGNGSQQAHIVVWELRVPRTLAAFAVGLALAVAGGVMQALVRNPLADPGLLGVNAGAAFFVAVAVALLGVRSVHLYAVFAFAGALLVTVLVYRITTATARPPSSAQLVLGGVAVGAALSGITSALSVLNPDAFDQMRFWNAGSLANRSIDALVPLLPFLVVGLVLALLAGSSFNALALGEDSARALGARVSTTRVLGIVAITLLAGSATAIAGPIAFVGLMMPHVARWMVGPDHRWILAYSALLGPILVLVADVIGRIATPGELPVGIVTAFLGAPVLLVLVRSRRGRP
ncbi:iron complex transport system permease protein [Quadrisphaera granulorum]|uniref:Iron complex transport system permease protein n=1 Tax=Quadrisphaera granulorum TaxID=317664 RepID=A0A316A9I6_9ACTN|nr:iron chelate uptake ABC transporter family permease subunit [Quadrisphaera granulorum]PWJ54351.1 iron complex transport system permease protein [Quadrisphaera granulorum]SZE96123.1 iron complex transport system permease protein [Quadrisphaera granulorum]